MTFEEKLTEIVHTTRENQGGKNALGNCIENAKVLKQRLEQNFPDCTVRISYGAVDYNQGERPQSYVQAKKNGEHHHWIVIQCDGTTWHCDLASESKSCFPPGSEPMIRQETPPEDYIDFGHRRDK